MATTTYNYASLDRTPAQIRLLDVLPGRGTIRCRLRHVPIETPGDYEALSYSWGNGVPDSQIFVDDRILLVTPNLHTALDYLREGSKTNRQLYRLQACRPRTLWVDAICINQKDDQEKDSQIPLMRQIYMSCWRTVIWLGEHDWLTRSAIKGVEFLSSMADDPSDNNQPGERHYNWRQMKRHHHKGNRALRLLDPIRNAVEGLHAQAAFQSLFYRPWFTRTWVIQELALGRQAIFICGIYEMEWDDVIKAQTIDHAFFLDSPLIMRLLQQKWPEDDGFHDIGIHMLASWNKDVQKPRDKIYGLLGLPSSEGKEIPVKVNYAESKTDQHVFTEFTASYLKHTGNLQVLAISKGCKNSRSTPSDIPSWVIDWRDNHDLPLPWTWFGCGPFRASGLDSTSKPNGIVIEGELLGVRGFVLDSITRVSVVSESVIEDNQIGQSYVENVIDSFKNAVGFSRFLLDCMRICREYDLEDVDGNEETTTEPIKPTEVMTTTTTTTTTSTTKRKKGYYAHKTNQTITAAFWKTVLAETVERGFPDDHGVGSLHETLKDREIRETVEAMLTKILNRQNSSSNASIEVKPSISNKKERQQQHTTSTTTTTNNNSQTRRRRRRKMESLTLLTLYLTVLLKTVAPQNQIPYHEFFAWSGYTKRRKFFITKKGYFGLGPRETEVGDEVVLLEGGRAPVVVTAPRTTATGEGEEEGAAEQDDIMGKEKERGCMRTRRIVGESFVNGVMSGEAWEMGRGRCEVLWFE